MATTAAECTAHAGCLQTLPADVVARILALLKPEDVLAVAQCSAALLLHAHDEARVWRRLCQSAYGRHTPIDRWLQPHSTPRLYRQLYPVLEAHRSYVGVWQETPPASPCGAVYSFRWAADGIQVVQLLPERPYLTRICHKHVATLGPAHTRHQAVVVDGTKCLLQDFGSGRGRHAPALCHAAEAAASVAVGGPSMRSSSSGSSSASGGRACGSWGGSPGQEAPAGSSPGSGFCAELLRFMQNSVQKTRSGRRNRRAGSDPPPVTLHLRRVPGPLRAPASRHHPHQLAGLHKGLYGPHGCEIVAVSYDFSGRSAAIVATKLTGDPNVPAGRITWRAAAAPLPTPWPQQEADLVARRPALVAACAACAASMAEAEAEEEAAGDIIAALMQQHDDDEDEGQGHGQDGPHHPEEQHEEGGGGGAAGAARGGADGIAAYAMRRAAQQVARVRARAAAMLARRVAAVYLGQGRVAGVGYAAPQLVEGRLWVYDDGSCGFVWALAPQLGRLHLIDYERLDGDL